MPRRSARDRLDTLRRRMSFTLSYLRGQARWDTGISPPELVETIEGPHAAPPGRALDLGCGTGTNALYLARHGWHATGVDFAGPAIARAKAKAAAAATLPGSVRFLRGDVTALETLDLGAPFDLLFDVGCLHGLPPADRARYAAGLSRVAAPQALFLLYTFSPRVVHGRTVGMTQDEVRALLAADFTVERVLGGTFHDLPSAWFWLRRLDSSSKP
ncbi:MAG TPA: methyltransferase domain-containing protein [Ktedonobacterales bacterium]|nr:methyltransferase domain-containing protein [Ktedonobacterales bacterium]